MFGSQNLSEALKVVLGLTPTVPASSTPNYVKLKGSQRVGVLIIVKNATTVTGSAITLKQATAVAGTGEKALSFSTAWRNIDASPDGGDVLTQFSVSNDTFTTDATDSKSLIYFIDVKPEDLDIANGFNCLRVGTGNATAATVTVVYLLGNNRYEPVQAIDVTTA